MESMIDNIVSRCEDIGLDASFIEDLKINFARLKVLNRYNELQLYQLISTTESNLMRLSKVASKKNAGMFDPIVLYN